MEAGLGRIPIEPVLYGTWPITGNPEQDFPTEVQFNAGDGIVRTFKRSFWEWPLFSGVICQYREAVDYDAMHLLIYRNGTYRIDHVDEVNPSKSLLQHAALDAPIVASVGCAVVGFGLGLVGGLLMMRQSYAQENPTEKLSKKSVEAAADERFGRDLAGMVPAEHQDRKVYYDKRRKQWVVEYDTDPAIYYRAYIDDDGSIQFENITP